MMYWRDIQRKNFVHWEKLSDFIELDPLEKRHILQRSHFPLNLPYRLAEKIRKGTLDDPILRQFVPTMDEQIDLPGFGDDPVGDASCRESKKLIHKYEGRVLLVCTSACAMHCRYCFRQNFDYETEKKGFTDELSLIAEDDSIREVILSGGDPLSLSDEILQNLLQEIDAIPHVRRIRFHSRFPIGIPERVTPELIAILKNLRARVWFVTHCNHPKELDQDVLQAFAELQCAGIVVMNQAVLLRHVNDDVKTLKELAEVLADHGILFYYLHQLDRVRGASHFEVSEEKGKQLIRQLSAQLSGYAVPKYVREVAGEPNKIAI